MTNNKGKKILSVTLSLAMLLSAIPLTALSSYAENNMDTALKTAIEQKANIEIENEETVKSEEASKVIEETEAEKASTIASFETQAVEHEEPQYLDVRTTTYVCGDYSYRILEDGRQRFTMSAGVRWATPGGRVVLTQAQMLILLFLNILTDIRLRE